MDDAPQVERTQIGKAWLLSTGHGVTDMYAAFLAGLGPVIKERLVLSNALYGSLGTLFSLTCNLSQPIWGYLSDKVGGRAAAAIGTILAGVFMVALLRAHSYAVIAACVLAAGLGVAMFHPVSASMLGSVSGRRRGLAMGLLSAGGAVGFSMGPLLAVTAYQHLPGATAWLAVIPALLMAGALQAWAPPAPVAEARERGSTRRAILPQWRPLLLVTLVVAARAGVVNSFHLFVPVMLRAEGRSLYGAAFADTVFIFAGAFSGLVCGHLADRFGGRAVTVATLLGATPALLLFLNAHGVLALVFFGLGGALVSAAVPVNIVMAQEIVPTRAGIASSLAMGVAWGAGGFLVTPVGWLADVAGYRAALTLVAWLAVIGALLCLPLRRQDSNGAAG
jgi:FSR family fosmidomycin resistance protein-like MFS transporter